MLLSDTDILAELSLDGLWFEPKLGDNAVQPASVDLRLGTEFRIFANHIEAAIDPANQKLPATTPVRLDKHGSFVLQPGEFVLGHTQETVQIPAYLAAQVAGKSSLGRQGLIVHATAGFIDPGFRGQITLELSNCNRLPIVLRPGMKICQITITRLSSPAEMPYGDARLGSHYQGQTGARPGEGL